MEGVLRKMKDFLLSDSWFDKEYKKKSSSRYLTFKTALNLFSQRGFKNIVETGTIRQEDDWGAGMSTLMFADFLSREVPPGRLYTVDIEEKNMEVCKKVTKNYERFITYVVQDSLKFLSEHREPIHLLYLDSLDYPLTEAEGNRGECQRHQRNELRQSLKNLQSGSIVLLDDNEVGDGGKTKLTKEEMLKNGRFEIIMEYQQSLWQKI